MVPSLTIRHTARAKSDLGEPFVAIDTRYNPLAKGICPIVRRSGLGVRTVQIPSSILTENPFRSIVPTEISVKAKSALSMVIAVSQVKFWLSTRAPQISSAHKSAWRMCQSSLVVEMMGFIHRFFKSSRCSQCCLSRTIRSMISRPNQRHKFCQLHSLICGVLHDIIASSRALELLHKPVGPCHDHAQPLPRPSQYSDPSLATPKLIAAP